MHNQPPTLPSINTVGNGIEYGDIARIKQEKDVVAPPLPPIQALNDNSNNNNSRMSINQLCNDPDEEMKKAAAVLENMKQTALPPIEVTQLSNNSHEGSVSSPNSDGLISRLGEIPFVRGAMTAYEQDTLMGGDTENESRKRKVRGEPARDSSPSYRTPPSRTHRTSQSNGSQNMLVGAGAAVGTARAVVSEESMKSLRYCLQWLQVSIILIEIYDTVYTTGSKHQIAILRDLIVKLTTPSSNNAVIHSNATSTLSAIKKEIVENLRKVIDVVSRYASKCLPEQAKQNVRSFILSLPTRWASINHSDISASPLSSPQLDPINAHQNHQTADYARRLLSLATESLDMLRRVGGIFGDTVERAEAWVERLRSIPPVGCFRPRKSSNSSRMSNRKYNNRFYVEDDDESINNYDSDDSDDSEVENKRMEDNRSHRSPKNSNSIKSPPPHNGLNSGKKRKKVEKKDDGMDLTEPF
ncbi:129_t:CDS:2 [Acaulospora colombiana]|uniref:129_t:CDS:1 n=1 Tax=Acaulospora colombiana TaxID=27376 RepID=A0ACA9MYV4_9GLOM|nr:129_t:CDS:2 [Acaulospora colombiana]